LKFYTFFAEHRKSQALVEPSAGIVLEHQEQKRLPSRLPISKQASQDFRTNVHPLQCDATTHVVRRIRYVKSTTRSGFPC
jgi:hypothetical protein